MDRIDSYIEEDQRALARGAEFRAIAKAAVDETWGNDIVVTKALDGFDLGREEIEAIVSLRRLAWVDHVSPAVIQSEILKLTRNMDDWIEDYLFERGAS